MSAILIQAAVDAIYAQQVDNEMGTERYALLFEPGTYGSQTNPLDIPVGYYTEVDGLGQDPSAVVINGGVTAVGKNGSGALDIFWRSVSNLTIHVVPTADGCHTGNEMWAVSQAAPMRRVDVKDFTTFMPYCENPNFASGGFVADSRLEGGALNGSQQQFYVRNSDLGHRLVQLRMETGSSLERHRWRAAPEDVLTNGHVLHDARRRLSGEQGEALPGYIDGSGTWNVFVPSAQTNSIGPARGPAGCTPGTSIPHRRSSSPHRRTRSSTINAALSPGPQSAAPRPASTTWTRRSRSMRADMVVEGVGMATLTASNWKPLGH